MLFWCSRNISRFEIGTNEKLRKDFALWDLEEPVFFGNKGWFEWIHAISLQKWNIISKLLTQHGMRASWAVGRLMQHDVNISVRRDTLNEAKCASYRNVVKSPMYVAARTRPDLCVVSNAFGSYVVISAPNLLAAAKYALQYLCETANCRTELRPGPHHELWAYVDAR